jgi:phosphohistidine phosphatase
VHDAEVAKTLYLIRHLKSAWDEPGLPDRERPLAPRGRKAGKKIAKHLKKKGVAPELVLCSPSVRTRQTLEAVQAGLGEPEVRFPPDLYAASEEELLDILRGAPRQTGSVLVIAHNPGLQDLAVALAGGGDEDARRRLAEKLPTGALATLTFPGRWAELAPGRCRLEEYVVPREL